MRSLDCFTLTQYTYLITSSTYSQYSSEDVDCISLIKIKIEKKERYYVHSLLKYFETQKTMLLYKPSAVCLEKENSFVDEEHNSAL